VIDGEIAEKIFEGRPRKIALLFSKKSTKIPQNKLIVKSANESAPNKF
jgi:hypothetical protein